MILNYLKLAFRNAIRQPFYTLVNVVGLTIGMVACWLLAAYYFHEKQYDTFLPHANRIAAAALDLKMGDTEGVTTNTPPPLGMRLAEYPEVEMTARTFGLGDVLMRQSESSTNTVFSESNAFAVDSTFLSLFEFPMVQGDKNALNAPLSLVLTEKMAQKYFGTTQAVGKSLSLNDRLFRVTGVIKDLPTNASLNFGFLVPVKDFRVVENFSWSWIWLQVDTWVKFRQPLTETNIAALETKLPAMVQKHAPSAFQRVGQNFEEQLKRGDRYNVRLLPLTKLHLGYPQLSSRLTTIGDGNQVRMLALGGLIILLLACVNFINLSTARSMKRVKEVGVRKALGSSKGSLVGQFLVESSLLSGVAFVLATALAWSVLPLFNQLTQIAFTPDALFSMEVMRIIVVLPIITGLVAGLYPALYLSRFKTTDSMKKSTGSAHGGFSLVRSGLVVLQFSVAIVLMLGVTAMYRQLYFAQHSKLGMEKENVLIIKNGRHFANLSEREMFRQQLKKLPEVTEATHSTFLPSLGSFGDFYEPEQGEQANAVVQNLPISSFMTDEHFVPTLKLEIIAGRNFRPNSPSDSASVILNETAVKAIGWKNPIGKWMRYPGNENQRFQVIGVMRDFHLGSVRTVIDPTALFHESSKTYRTWGSYLAVRLQPGTEKATIQKATDMWKRAIPNVPFEYDFLDASFASLYRSEQHTASIIMVFTGLALFIGCLGLFALALFMSEQRTKEIGIRKVLGASVLSVTALLSKDFLKLVVIALLIASPIGYYLINKWLADFAYRIDIGWGMFAATGVVAVLIALLTVGFQSFKSALTNPVKSLKAE